MNVYIHVFDSKNCLWFNRVANVYYLVVVVKKKIKQEDKQVEVL